MPDAQNNKCDECGAQLGKVYTMPDGRRICETYHGARKQATEEILDLLAREPLTEVLKLLTFLRVNHNLPPDLVDTQP